MAPTPSIRPAAASKFPKRVFPTPPVQVAFFLRPAAIRAADKTAIFIFSKPVYFPKRFDLYSPKIKALWKL
jgi:hypothetical protein